MSASPSMTASGDTTPTGSQTPTTFMGTNETSVNDKEEESATKIQDNVAEFSKRFPKELPEETQVLQEALISQPCVGSFDNSDAELVVGDSFANLRYQTPSAHGKPDIVLALTSFSIPAPGNPAFMISPAHQTISGFDVLLTGGNNSTLRSLSFKWLEISPNQVNSRLWQHGRCVIEGEFKASTSSTRKDGHSARMSSRSILFDYPFDEPPKVVLFLAGLNISPLNTLNLLRVHPTNITERGFFIWTDSHFNFLRINKIKISWIAYSSTLTGVHSGSVSTNSSLEPQLFNMGYEAFPEGTFKKAPRVFFGLSHFSLKAAAGKEQNLKCYVSHVNQLGMCWNTDSWGNTVLFSAGLSYLAIEDPEED